MERLSASEYKESMAKNYWVMRYGIPPAWDPSFPGDVSAFIHDECLRQGWDVRTNEGFARVRWMIDAWDHAQARCYDGHLPNITDVKTLGFLCEPPANSSGHGRYASFRVRDVFIGDRKAPLPAAVPHMMAALIATVRNVERNAEGKRAEWSDDGQDWWDGVPTPDDFYLRYEFIHPFMDGNGRSGKILHNWLLNTLGDPVLIADYFGGGNP